MRFRIWSRYLMRGQYLTLTGQATVVQQLPYTVGTVLCFGSAFSLCGSGYGYERVPDARPIFDPHRPGYTLHSRTAAPLHCTGLKFRLGIQFIRFRIRIWSRYLMRGQYLTLTGQATVVQQLLLTQLSKWTLTKKTLVQGQPSPNNSRHSPYTAIFITGTVRLKNEQPTIC
jgi:hypothetical protein